MNALQPHPSPLCGTGSTPSVESVCVAQSAANGKRAPGVVLDTAERSNQGNAKFAVIATAHRIEVIDFYKQETK